MINLLPTELKAQVAFSKRNAVLKRNLLLAATILIAATTALACGEWYARQRIVQAQEQIDVGNRAISQYASLETQAKALSDRLSSIQKIQQTQAKFSLLLTDLAAATPGGVAIQSISLTGDDKTPVRISASSNTYKNALAFREGLASSPRIKAADIESLNVESSGAYTVSVTIAFKPGKSR